MTLSVFLLTALLLLLLLSMVIIWPWLRPKADTSDLLALNVTVFEDRLAELERDQHAGRLDAASYAEQKLELERQLLAVSQELDATGERRTLPRWMIGMVYVWVPLLSFLAYLLIDDRQAVFKYWQAQDQHAVVAEQLLTQKIDAPPANAAQDGIGLLQAMQANVYRHAADPQRWFVLSEAYLAAEAVQPSLEALARAHRLAPDDDKIAMTYAQLRFFSQEGKLDDEARQVIDHLLAKNSDHEGAIMLMGMATYRGGQFDDAVGWLERLKALRLAQGSTAQDEAIVQLDGVIANAKQQGVAAQSSQLVVNVTISDALKAQLQPTDSLFVYARALTGAPMPYAVQKLDVTGLLRGETVSVTLSDQTAMMPSRTLSSARQTNTDLVVGARVSKSGNPVGAVGDLEALPVPVGREKQFSLQINQTR